MSVKVVIQCDADAGGVPCIFENIGVFPAIHSNLDHVDGVNPLFSQALSGGGRETLIQQESAHATRSVDRRSSSTVAAA